jgi:prephenate dehydrogenase
VTGAGDPLREAGTIAVVGLGLVGGSLARDLAARGHRVIGADRDARVVEAALGAGVITGGFAVGEAGTGTGTGRGTGGGTGRGEGTGADRGTGTGRGTGGGGGVEEAGVVVVATPVRAAASVVRWLARAARGDAIITDVGSTKRSVMEVGGAAGLGGRFVGGHPMAGDHGSGWRASREGLFLGAPVWLCAGEEDAGQAQGPDGGRPMALVEALWEEVGGRPRWIDAAAHDHIVAWSSHLPQMVATALACALDGAGVDRAQLGPGGRDTTRLAGSDPTVWTDILMDNADAVEPALDALIEELVQLRRHMRGLDDASLGAALEGARQWTAGVRDPAPAGGP